MDNSFQMTPDEFRHLVKTWAMCSNQSQRPRQQTIAGFDADIAKAYQNVLDAEEELFKLCSFKVNANPDFYNITA
jgi:hypothetical protein